MIRVQLTKMHYLFILAGILIILFFFSLTFFLVLKGNRTRLVLFFPDRSTGKLIGEERYIKKENSYEENIKNLISEILLGPSLPYSSPLFSPDTELISIFLKQKHLSVNFSKQILKSDMKMKLDFHTSLQACINALKFNFPGIKYISFFVNGELVPLQREDEVLPDDENIKIKFSSELIK